MFDSVTPAKSQIRSALPEAQKKVTSCSSFVFQCIPTPVAWYFQKIPSWFHRLSVVLT